MLTQILILSLIVIDHHLQYLITKRPISLPIKLTVLTMLSLLSCSNTFAAECRHTKSVGDSVKQLAHYSFISHSISTQLPDQPHHTETPQFLTKMAFYQAWQNWQQFRGAAGPIPKQCDQSQNELIDCVPTSITKTRQARICSQQHSDPNCKDGTEVKPIKIAFKYTKNAAGNWILSAVYPSIYDNCS